jgi:hypothetical protein
MFAVATTHTIPLVPQGITHVARVFDIHLSDPHARADGTDTVIFCLRKSGDEHLMTSSAHFYGASAFALLSLQDVAGAPWYLTSSELKVLLADGPLILARGTVLFVTACGVPFPHVRGSSIYTSGKMIHIRVTRDTHTAVAVNQDVWLAPDPDRHNSATAVTADTVWSQAPRGCGYHVLVVQKDRLRGTPQACQHRGPCVLAHMANYTWVTSPLLRTAGAEVASTTQKEQVAARVICQNSPMLIKGNPEITLPCGEDIRVFGHDVRVSHMQGPNVYYAFPLEPVGGKRGSLARRHAMSDHVLRAIRSSIRETSL